MPPTPEQPIFHGHVKFFKGDKGVGALVSPDVPNDVWIHFSCIETREHRGYRTFEAGQRVEFQYEDVPQDSFRCRATWARALEP